jgi:hypothetical protein
MEELPSAGSMENRSRVEVQLWISYIQVMVVYELVVAISWNRVLEGVQEVVSDQKYQQLVVLVLAALDTMLVTVPLLVLHHTQRMGAVARVGVKKNWMTPPLPHHLIDNWVAAVYDSADATHNVIVVHLNFVHVLEIQMGTTDYVQDSLKM